MKIAHIADVHIRNYKYKDVYESVFNDLYDSLEDKGVDVIVLAGDIAHNKTNISPEYVKMASDFFKELSDIAKTIVIRGNHDMNLSNLNREDAISPIVENIHSDNLIYLKDSQEYEIDDVVFNHLAITDNDWITDPTHKDKINIALYHGMIKGSKNSSGHTFQHGDIAVGNFKNFDFVMLGDIHKTNQILDTEGKVRYCGSLIQQNFGEEEEKGYLLWDIKGKEDFDCKLVELESPKPFQTIELEDGELLKKNNIKKGSRLRIKSGDGVGLEELRKIVKKVKLLYNPESVKYEQSSIYSFRKDIDSDEDSESLNLRSVSTQEKLIKEYLSGENLNDDEFDQIFKINKEMNKRAEVDTEEIRNLDWNIKKIEWSNLFNYGASNKINFEKLSGIVGIFGENYSGKSSAVEALIYTIFNSTSKNIRKTVDIINQNKDKAECEVLIEMGGTKYKITRVSEKYKKKLHGKTSIEASTEANFKYYNEDEKKWKSLNGNNRWETEDNIRSYFGTLDNFLLTNYAHQFGSLNFISERSTQRKRILAKFLDLEFFEKKYDCANEEYSYYRSGVKKEEDKEYDKWIEEAKLLIRNHKNSIKKAQEKCEKIKGNIRDKENEIRVIGSEIQNMPDSVEDIKRTQKELNGIREEKEILSHELEDLKARLEYAENEVSQINDELDSIETNEEDDQHIIEKSKEISEKIEKIESRISDQEELITEYKTNEGYIEEAPCNNEYSDCQLVKNAHDALERLGDKKALVDKMDELEAKLEGQEGTLDEMNVQRAQENLKLRTLCQERVSTLKQEISNHQYVILKMEQELNDIVNQEDNLNKKIKNSKKDKILLENKKKLEKKRDSLREEKSTLDKKLKGCEQDVLKFTKKHGYYENKLEDLKEKKEEKEDMVKNYRYYKLYKKTVHNNGIPFDIIRSKLPIINEHINTVLSSFVDFEVFFIDEDDKLEIYLKHPKYEPRLIETCSGAEKMISAMSIRLALMAVTSLPKANTFVLDEPATELDAEHMTAFQTTVLDTIKNYFDNVILISHLTSLKDIADNIIEIDKKLGYAHISV